MIFLIADTFQTALAKLDNASQKAAKLCAFDLAQDPSGPGKQFHRIDRSKEKNFWSVRANRDIRIIVHKTADRFTLCYVDHHDDAYDWAERRVFETHPTTGALQIVELVERVEETIVAAEDVSKEAVELKPAEVPAALAHVPEDDLLAFGVPPRWVATLLEADEEQALRLTDHLPAEASEAVLALLMGETPVAPAEVVAGQSHPDEQRRFRVVEHIEALEAALNYPWDKWTVFLHPSQQRIVDGEYSGPARVAGSAGTGKTVVALHRAVRMSKRDQANVLLTTYSKPLASALQQKVGILTGEADRLVPNIKVASFIDAACELYELEFGHKPVLVKPDLIERSFTNAAPNEDLGFLISEWREVVDGWQINEAEEYYDLKRTGRRSRVSRGERERLWPIFEATRATILRSGKQTEAMVFGKVADAYGQKTQKPFTNVIVDEAQDLGIAELRFLSAISDQAGDALFFAGDLGQRIFRLPFSWKALGIDVRGRSTSLKVNYRTSHQVRAALDKLLPAHLADLDGIEEDRRGTVSVFNGPKPAMHKAETEDAEVETVQAWVQSLVAEGIPLREIGIIVRAEPLLPRARKVGARLNIKVQTLTESLSLKQDALPIGTMHLAKGLEFRAVAVMGCDDRWLPLEERLGLAITEHDLEEVYSTERHLFYVACTRAREFLHVSGVKPVSDFFADIVEA